jgi:AcrR family transcriptional regulator
MRHRAETTAATHARILTTARDLLAAGEPLTVVTVAQRAGLARPTVYEHVGDRAGLLAAVIADAQARGGVDQAIAAAWDEDPVEGMHGWLRHALDFWRREGHVLGPAWRQAMGMRDLVAPFEAEERRRLLRARQVTQRLATTGRLSGTMSNDDAARTLWLLSSLRCYEQLAASTEDLEGFVLTCADSALLGGARHDPGSTG